MSFCGSDKESNCVAENCWLSSWVRDVKKKRIVGSWVFHSFSKEKAKSLAFPSLSVFIIVDMKASHRRCLLYMCNRCVLSSVLCWDWFTATPAGPLNWLLFVWQIKKNHNDALPSTCNTNSSFDAWMKQWGYNMRTQGTCVQHRQYITYFTNKEKSQ